uniref:Uncharacterized protein n=1 Tax=viral metagenome TaxID=1070528 RepID=A0A6C0KQ64_9ZZZZ
MPVQKFLELDSTYRNRNADPNPASFTVNMSQYGLRNGQNAIDPVSNAYPQIIFSPKQYTNNSDITIAGGGGIAFIRNTYFGIFTLLLPPSTQNTLYLEYTVNLTAPVLPFVKDIFVGLNITQNLPGYPYRRINEWECIYSQPSSPTKQIFKAVIDSAFSTMLSPLTFVIPIYQAYPLYFLPSSLCIPDYYNKFYIQNQTLTFSHTPPQPEYASIIDFDRESHYASAGPLISGTAGNWSPSNTYVIRKEIPIISSVLSNNSLNNLSVLVGNTFFETTTPNSLINAYINFFSLNGGQYSNKNSKIIAVAGTTSWGQQVVVNYATESTIEVVKNDGTIEVVEFTTLILALALPAIPQKNDQYEILQFSNDNYSPFVYTGTMSSNSQPVSYDITLNSLTLPNRLLSNGGRIAYYPYVYVIIENISTTGGNPKNMIYSNNPNTYKAVFRAPITDMNHPSMTPFVKLNGNGIKQTMVFKQNDDMSLTVLLPNGEIFKIEEDDTSNGQSPNPVLQVSAVFSMERIQ